MSPTLDLHYELDDRYRRRSGRVYLSGIQALVRLMLEQRRLDGARGLNTAGFVSGYRGSPLAGFDRELARAARHLERENVLFQPAVNEALAATAVMGTQQVESFGGARVDGVFALWYGKGPGVDWAGDAIKHGNAYGTSPRGGVLAVAGDDHGAVSSTMAHQSDQTFAAWYLPVLAPASIAEYLLFGLYGFALSRFSGAWVGFKAIAETVEGAMSVRLPESRPRFREPEDFTPPADGLHFRWNDPPSVAIEARLARKLEAAVAFARTNPLIDRLVVEGPGARLGIVTVGKAHGDLMEALAALGFTSEKDIARLGIRIYKVGQSFPLEPSRIRSFARGLEEILVVEEKRPFVETQIRDLLYGLPESRRPRVVGKRDEKDREMLPAFGELRPHRIAPLLAARLRRLHPGLDFSAPLARLRPPTLPAPEVRRIPWFCSGCPHNSSTLVPEGSKAMGGIGCHIMATWMDRETIGITHMGGEGANWMGLAPFVETPHVFQNLGDGTYFHSGLLAIRQAVAAGLRITYKILYNDAVAMTGGQRLDGPLTVPGITRQLREEGVERIVVVTDKPGKYPRDAGFAPGVEIRHRRDLLAVEEALRAHPGVSALVYDQTCAAEKRRRRKRGSFPDPARRAFINELVCEACGDCSKVSNCLSIVPVETPLGTKRRIDQSSCNKDFSCIEGFCPSFVTVEGGELGRGAGLSAEDLEARLRALPSPALPAIGAGFDLLVTGVGGTGVLTVGAILGMAAHLEGRAVSVLDFTGLAQKGGAVLSHLRIGGDRPLHQARIEPGETETLIACDPVVAVSPDALATLRRGRSRVVANLHCPPTADIFRDPRHRIDSERLLARLRRAAGSDRVDVVDAHRLALAATGDAIGANLLLTGYAWQRGLIPISLAAIERAIALNGVAVEANLRAFACGRLAAADPGFPAGLPAPDAGPPKDFESLLAHRRAHLVAYQDETYAVAYEALVRAVAARERALFGDGRTALAGAVAEGLFRMMAVKDEYEVARLYTDGHFERKLRETFTGDYRLRFHFAPPLLSRLRDGRGRPRKFAFGPWILPPMRLLARMKFLRGTALDPFGWTAERRLERRLCTEYRAMIGDLLESLDHHNYEIAVKLAALPDLLRGFGHVRRAAVARYQRERRALLAAFARTPTGSWPIAAE